ncbi:MAG: aryl-sulfate sulfotransferase [Nannocystaceae bacterium]|nr:aryl-sulfate sulfotransferase [Nannocystaceae bacterium]
MTSYKSAAVTAGLGLAIVGGLWAGGVIGIRHPLTEDGTDGGPQQDQAEAKAEQAQKKLEALGYISAVPIAPGEANRRGVTHHDASVPSDELFIVNPTWERAAGGPVREAFLMRMDGTKEHVWKPAVPDSGDKGWGGARLDDEGFLHVVADGALIKYDWDGVEVWRHDARHHHDLGFGIDGAPVVVSEQMREVPGVGGVDTLTIKDHGLTFFSREGEVIRTMWLFDVLGKEPRYAEVLAEIVKWKRERFGKEVEWDRPNDVFHLNSLDVLPRDVEGLGKRGDVLISPRRFNRIFVVDSEAGEVRWRWGEGELDEQHDPTLSPDGRVVVFDNGKHRKYSRVLSVDPATGTIVREHRGLTPYYSSGRGSAQGLADGGLFVVVSNEARMFRVGPEGEASTWEFVSGWVQNGARLPLRGVQLQGAALERARSILAKQTPAPRAAQPRAPAAVRISG